MQFSVVIPFHRNLGQLSRCLAAVRAATANLPEGTSLRETIIVADGAPDDPSQVAAANGAGAARAVPYDGSAAHAAAACRNRRLCMSAMGAKKRRSYHTSTLTTDVKRET